MKHKQKSTLFASIGSAFEYYDFIIYAMLIPILAPLFFPNSASQIQIIQSFLLFGLAYLARPFGALLFGLLGDYLGAAKTLSYLMIMMGVATFSMGLLPIFEKAGFYAPLLLGSLRFIQGISFGAELPGAIHYLSEHHPTQERGRAIGWALSGTTIGALCATFILWLIRSYYTNEHLSAWAWRIPFFFGGIVAIIGYKIRASIVKTDRSIKQINQFRKTAGTILKSIAQQHKMTFFTAIMITLLPATLVIINLYFPTYLTRHYKFELAKIYSAMSYAMGFTILISPFIGRYFTDVLGPKRALLFASFFILIMLPIQSILLKAGQLQSFLIIHQFFIILTMVSCFTLLSNLFAQNIRFTALAISYNLGYLIAAFSPSLLTMLAENFGRNILFSYMGTISIITFLSVIKPQKMRPQKQAL